MPVAPASPAEPAKPEPPVVGLGLAAGARRPGAKKAAPAAAPAAPAPAAEPATVEPVVEAPAAPSSNGATGNDDRVVGDEAPVKGLGIAKGAGRPGKR